MANFLEIDLGSLPDIYQPLLNLLRGDKRRLDGYLNSIEVNCPIDNTRVLLHCFNIQLDGNGRPRIRDLAEKLRNHVTDYVIPRSVVNAAAKSFANTNSAAEFSRLERIAATLFTDVATTGEGGELLLCVLTEEFLKLPQLICKMALKTDPQMHYQGSDGIHAGINEDGALALYWGESKLYQNPFEAIDECIRAIAKYLNSSGGQNSETERDLQLLRDNLDLNDAKLEEALKKYLDRDNSLFGKIEFRGVCLVGFDYKDYPSIPNTKVTMELEAKIKKSLSAWKNRINNGILIEKLETFTINMFCIPFPSVSQFRKEFLKTLGHDNGTA